MVGVRGYNRNTFIETIDRPEPRVAELRGREFRGERGRRDISQDRICHNATNGERRKTDSDAECEPPAKQTL